MKKGINLIFSRSYDTTCQKLYGLFEDHSFFKLTGADNIQCDFKPGGSFQFGFNGRGKISGRFAEIVPLKQITIEWNVDGFGLEPEQNTELVISLKEKAGCCTLTLKHSKIKQHESATAKTRAWKETLEALEKALGGDIKNSVI